MFLFVRLRLPVEAGCLLWLEALGFANSRPFSLVGKVEDEEWFREEEGDWRLAVE